MTCARTNQSLLCWTAALFIGVPATTGLAENDVAGELIVFNDNGAWSWFEDERAIVDTTGGKILVSSVAHASGSGGADRHGDVEIAAYDLATGAIERFTLSDALQADDHNSAALWRRSDGKYLALYSKHNGDQLTRFRISQNAGSITAFISEQTFSNGTGTTYSNLHFLAGENGGAGRLYNITRSVGIDPNVLISSDEGQSWSYGGRLLNWPVPVGDPKYTGSDGSRPYLKYASNGTDEIHFITSEDHPRAYDNGIYHGVIRGGKVYDSFGNEVDGNLLDSNAFPPTAYTQVFNTDTSPLGHAWTTDLHLDDEGHPYAAFTARANNTNTSDHRFLYASFDGAQWQVHEVAKAGGFLYPSEQDYTGLVALDPSDRDRLFISTNIDPRTSVAMPHYEIFVGTTADGGANWTWAPITFNSTMDNLRPIVPKWGKDQTALLWMRGNYATYTNYDLDIVGLTHFGPLEPNPVADLDGDRDVDLEDFVILLSGLHTNVAGLPLGEARQKGDLNGDSAINFADFMIFRNAYDLRHGMGSLAEAGRIAPEPGTWLLLAVSGATTMGGWRFAAPASTQRLIRRVGD